MTRMVLPGSVVIDQFPVFEFDGYTKHPGLDEPDFEIVSFHNGVDTTIPVFLTAIGSTGEYRIIYVPPHDGLWKVQVFIPFNKDHWESTIVASMSASDNLLAKLEESLSVLHELGVDITRVLGLLHYNAIVDKQEYDGKGQLVYARVRVFDSPEKVPANPGGSETDGLIHEYDVRATWTDFGITSRYSLKKVL